MHRARWGEKTGEIVVEIVQDGGGWLRHRLYLVPGVLLGGLEHYLVQAPTRMKGLHVDVKNFNFQVFDSPRSSL